MKIKAEFEELLEGLNRQCIYGYSHWKIWRQMNDLIADYNAIISYSMTFYSMSMRAHESCFVMQLSKLFDKSHKKHVGLHYYLNFIEKNTGLFSEEAKRRGDRLEDSLKKDNKAIEEKWEIVNNINKWRNKNYAHIDQLYQINPDRIKEEYPVSVGEIEKLYRVAGDILNRYSLYFNKSSMGSWEFVKWDDFRHLLEHAKDGIEARKRDFKQHYRTKIGPERE